MIANEGGRRIRDEDIVVEANVRMTVARGSTDRGAGLGIGDVGTEVLWPSRGSPPMGGEAGTSSWSAAGAEERVDELCILLLVRKSVLNVCDCIDRLLT